MTHSFDLPPLETLRAVLAAHEAGSFTAAAELLNISHGAVSRRIALAEQWAHCRLFDRHGRGVRATIGGQRVIAKLEHAFAVLDEGRSHGDEAAAPEVIRVGIVPSFARLWLLPNLAKLEGVPPDLRVIPEIDNRNLALSDARIAIRYGTGEWPGLNAIPLFDEILVPVACADIALQLSTEAEFSLLRFPLIHDASTSNWIRWLASSGISYGLRAKDRIFSQYDLALQAAAEGHGLAMLRHPYGGEYWEKAGLRRISSRHVTNPLKFYIVTKPGRLSASVESLVARFKRAALA